METKKPILCLDFDGVIHSYISPWKGPGHIPDPPVPGAKEFIDEALRYFTIVIYSSRSISEDGLYAMKRYMVDNLGLGIASQLAYANKKPAAFLTIDDRAMLFTGTFPNPQSLLQFKPWNRK